MPASKRPRKHYKPALVNAPVTAGLRAEFEKTLVTGQIAMLLNADAQHFDGIARAMNTIAVATKIKPLPTTYQADCKIMEGGMGAMQALGDRATKSGEWKPRKLEVEPIALACESALKILPALDVRALYAAMQRLRTQ